MRFKGDVSNVLCIYWISWGFSLISCFSRCGISGHAAVAKALVALGADKNSLGSTVEMGGAAGGVCGTSHALAADGQR
jgi:hypothetical protein